LPRRPVPIDLEELEKLAAMHCTEAEVAAWFSSPGATLTQQAISRKLKREPFKTVWATGRAKGSISLRRKQKQRADAGDRTMLIWLGKQWLGQADKQEVQHSTLDTIEAELARIERERERSAGR
jgi:hypothetical protein